MVPCSTARRGGCVSVSMSVSSSVKCWLFHWGVPAARLLASDYQHVSVVVEVDGHGSSDQAPPGVTRLHQALPGSTRRYQSVPAPTCSCACSRLCSLPSSPNPPSRPPCHVLVIRSRLVVCDPRRMCRVVMGGFVFAHLFSCGVRPSGARQPPRCCFPFVRASWCQEVVLFVVLVGFSLFLLSCVCVRILSVCLGCFPPQCASVRPVR